MKDALSTLPRVAVVAGYPPSKLLSGNILRNLLRDFPADKLLIVTHARMVRELLRAEGGGGLLQAAYVGIAPWHSRIRGIRRLLRVVNGLKVLTVAALLARRVSDDSVLLALPNGDELGSELFVAAYVAHLWTGAPLVVYELDEWRASLSPFVGAGARFLERFFHRRILRAAHTVWVISDELAENLHARFGIEARVLPHSVDIDSYRFAPRAIEPGGNNWRLLYTGTVYNPQAGAIRNVLSAIHEDPSKRWVLEVYTRQSEDQLRLQGIAGPQLVVKPGVPSEAIPSLLANADALLLPFSFEADQRSIVSTSFPSKTADYLASGVPILVHAPSYSTICSLANKEGWAVVVEDQQRARLLEALNSLRTNEALRQRLSHRSLLAAYRRHDIRTSRAEFVASICDADQSCLRRPILPSAPARP